MDTEKTYKDGLKNFVLAITIFFLTSIIYGIFFSKLCTSNNIVVATIFQLGQYIFLLIILFIFFNKRLKEDLKNFKKEYLGIAVKYWIMGLCIMFISNILISFFLKGIAANETEVRELLFKYPISNIITSTLLAPIAEEIVFRSSLKEGFKKWYVYCLLSALFFGLGHIIVELLSGNLSELLYLIPYGSLGFFFAKAFWDTDNIYTSIIAHIIHNSITVGLIFILL